MLNNWEIFSVGKNILKDKMSASDIIYTLDSYVSEIAIVSDTVKMTITRNAIIERNETIIITSGTIELYDLPYL